MFLDEARIASKVKHRNVVNVLDVVTMGEEVVLVQEYVHGAPLSLLLRNAHDQKTHVPIPVAAAIACQVLAGLHAAHETVDEMGTPLHIVHRDVSPQNIMIATDGSARLLDFGVAKASVTAHVTRKGTFKGKLGYSSPEQIRGEANKASDIYALGIVLWELLVGQRLHGNTQGEAQLIAEIMSGRTPTVTEALNDEKSWIGAYRWSQLETLEPIIRKALDIQHKRRWATAADMEEAIAQAVPIATAADIAQWLRAVGNDFLESREKMIAEEEASWRRTLAMTEAAVPLPQTDVQPSVGVATEPEAEGLIQRTNMLFKRGPTAIIAALVVLLSVGVALLLRDLDRTKPATASAAPSDFEAAPAAHVVEPGVAARAIPQPSPSRANVTPVAGPVRTPPAVPAEIQSTPSTRPSMSLPEDEPDDRVDLADDPDEPPAKTVSQKRTVTPKPPARPRAVKPAPARPPAPAHTVAPSPPPKPTATIDCGTPFYFEGNKKIFKPGCL